MDENTVPLQRKRTAILAELKDHRSWPELQQALDERRDSVFDKITRQLIAGAELDQRYLDRVAGFFIGAQWILDNPDLNERKLEVKLARAELLGMLEGEVNA